MIVSIVSLAIGGYVIIRSNFNSMLRSEVEVSYDVGDVVAYSIANEIEHSKRDSQSAFMGEKEEETIERIAGNVNIINSSGKIKFAIIGPSTSVLFHSMANHFDKTALKKMNSTQRGYIIQVNDHKQYIQAFRPVSLLGKTCYVETVRNVTSIFQNQSSQYHMLLQIMMGILAIAGLITYLLSYFLMRKIRLLTKVTQEISEGNYQNRVVVKGEDEISILSQNFNQMSRELEEKMEALQEEIQRREDFIGAFSHELKTPLTSIIGYSDMLINKEMTDENQKICANYIHSEGKRLEALSMRMLELVVLKNKELHRETIDIKDLLEEVSIMLVLSLKNSNVSMNGEFESYYVQVEPEILKTVFINIIDNGRKAIEKNGKINFTGKIIADGYEVKVQDNGCGMSKDELSKIKQAFYMVDKSRERKQGGAGLGLAICDEILLLHEFPMIIESEEGVGTTVTVLLKGGADETIEK